MPVRKRTKTNSAALLKILLLVLLFAFVFIFFFSAPLWQIKEVQVVGTQMLIPEDVAGVAGLPLGENLFLVRLSGPQQALQKIPQIASVKIKRRPPSTLVIEVKERHPYAVAMLSGKSFVIDKEGVLLNYPSEKVGILLPDVSELPVVTGLSTRVLSREVYLDPAYVTVIQQTFDRLFSILNTQKIKLDMEHINDISLLIEDVLRLKLGEGKDLDKKMENFRSLLPVLKNDFSRVEYIDLRYLNNPTIKFRS